MPYVSRLLEDSGVAMSSGPRAAIEPAAQQDAALVESDETIVLPSAGSQTLEPAPVREAPTDPTAPVQRFMQEPEAAARAPALEPAPPAPAIDSTREEMVARPAAPAPPEEPSTAVSAPQPSSRETAPAEAQGTVLETPEERVLRTIAIVREWTAAGFAEVPPSDEPPPALVEVTESPATPSVTVAPAAPAGLAEVILRLETPPAVEVEAAAAHGRDAAQGEPETVNVNLSVGAIEVTLEAPETAAPARPSEAAARPGPAEPDVRSILRRHYIRPPVGW